MRTAHRTPTKPRRPRTRDGSCLSQWRRELHNWHCIELGHAFAIRATSSAESHARRAPSAHPRRTRRFVRLGSIIPPHVDCLFSLSPAKVDHAARQNIERRIAQGRDQLALCAEEGQRLGELDREIKKEQQAHKLAMVSLCTITPTLLFSAAAKTHKHS